MNKLLLSGVVSNVKAFDGKVRFCFARIRTSKGTSFSITAFAEVVEKIAQASDKFVLAECYVKNGKQKDGTFKLEIVCTSVESMESEVSSSESSEQYSNSKSDSEDIPF